MRSPSWIRAARSGPGCGLKKRAREGGRGERRKTPLSLAPSPRSLCQTHNPAQTQPRESKMATSFLDHPTACMQAKPSSKFCVAQKLRNSGLSYHKNKNQFGAKFCLSISLQLLLYIMKLTSQEDQYSFSLNFSDVI